MNTRQLEHFLAVVDHGSFTRAAEHLHVAQPSLSQTIKGMERELGVPLFHRIGRSVTISAAGRALEGPARIVLRDLDTAASVIDELKGGHSGHLDLISMPSPGVEPLTELIAEYALAHPGVTLTVSAAFTAPEVLAAVRDGHSEIGILGTLEPLVAADLGIRHLGPQPMVVIAPRNARLSEGALTIEDLSGRRMIVSSPGSLMRQVVDDAINSGVDLPIAAVVEHRTSLLSLVEAGVGCAIMPSAWSRLAGALGLTVRPLTPEVALHLAIVSRPENLTPAAQSFLTLVDSAVDLVPYSLPM